MERDKGTNVEALPITNLAHVTIQMHNNEEMENFYSNILGLKQMFTLSMAEMLTTYIQSIENDPEKCEAVAEMKASLKQPFMQKPFLVYLRIAKRQFLELLYENDGSHSIPENTEQFSGLQNICFEVSDIHKTWDMVTAMGIIPDTELNLGADGAWQFWVKDPDGNRVEFMEYTLRAKQLM